MPMSAVEVKKTETPGLLDLEFAIQEGPRVTVREIIASGGIRRSRPRRSRARWPCGNRAGSSRRPFREDLLNKDLDNLQDRYLEAGYLSAGVKKTVTRSSDKRAVTVVIEISEGPQTRTGEVIFDGNKAFTPTELLSTVSLKQGAPFNERTVDEDRYRILSEYTNKGYLYAQGGRRKDPAQRGDDVRYRITEDLPVPIGRIILRGNERTKDHVIMRELLVKPGDTYDYSAILTSQQRIYRLGYFRVAKFEPVHPGEKEYRQGHALHRRRAACRAPWSSAWDTATWTGSGVPSRSRTGTSGARRGTRAFGSSRATSSSGRSSTIRSPGSWDATSTASSASSGPIPRS